MSDIIQLLPEAIANQIAAGEVVQRPSSVVKELVENAIDAGSSQIKVILKDAGKQLIQVIDNGVGMSETDARMSLERHATSKIRNAKDLFQIKTLGFRGEALASIAAVAQVEMRTRLHDQDLATCIQIEDSTVISQEPCQHPAGTNVAVKNLFYNVPARRKFLKSNTVELRYILDEFQRISIANPDISFELYNNEKEIYQLVTGSMQKRIISLLGKSLQGKLIPIEEETDVLKIKGYMGRPEAAKKKKGSQFLLVNDRYIKSPYLDHAIKNGYEQLIHQDSYPVYILNLKIDPSKIDVNVHPTKQIIKFDDERIIYNLLRAAVRHTISKHFVFPTLDFDQDPLISNIHPPNVGNQLSGVIVPSRFSKEVEAKQADWSKLYEGLEKKVQTHVQTDEPVLLEEPEIIPFQIHQTFITSQIKSGFILVHQQYAHERILFEKYLQVLDLHTNSTQTLLFPEVITLAPDKVAMLNDILPKLKEFGFDVQVFGKESFVVHGIPAHLEANKNAKSIIFELLEQLEGNNDLKMTGDERLAYALAKSVAIKTGQALSKKEMQTIIDHLFACEVPFYNPIGKKCFITFEMEELLKKY